MPTSTRSTLLRSFLLVLLVFILPVGCKKDAPPPPPKPEVAKVVSKDIELHTEWVGTTVGMINAKVLARVDGYLLSQQYEDGGKVERGEPLVEVGAISMTRISGHMPENPPARRTYPVRN